MSEAHLLEFHGATTDQYNAVNALLGLDPNTGEGDWPAGLLHHVGAADDRSLEWLPVIGEFHLR